MHFTPRLRTVCRIRVLAPSARTPLRLAAVTCPCDAGAKSCGCKPVLLRSSSHCTAGRHWAGSSSTPAYVSRLQPPLPQRFMLATSLWWGLWARAATGTQALSTTPCARTHRISTERVSPQPQHQRRPRHRQRSQLPPLRPWTRWTQLEVLPATAPVAASIIQARRQQAAT